MVQQGMFGPATTLNLGVPMKFADEKNSSPRMSRAEAAAYLGVAASTLAVWACTKRYNLPYIKVGRLVQYRRADLDNLLNERTVSACAH